MKLKFSIYLLIPLLLIPSLCHSLPFRYGKLYGSFDTTLSFGNIWRVEDRDLDLIGIANGGRAFTVNGDNGNLNYDKDESVSRVLKFTHDLGLNYQNYSGFVRVSYFYDFINSGQSTLTEEQEDRAGHDFELLDAFIRGQYEPWDRSLDVRIGNQVVTWGESTFIQNGINIINTVDVTKLRIPGSELREALLPSPMVWSSYELTKKLNIEGFYMARFDRVELDACGTYFSTSDVACEERNQKITTGFGLVPEGTPGFSTTILEKDEARNDGQFGVNLSYFLQSFNNTEVALTFINYHSRLPYLSAISRSPGVADLRFEYPEDIHLIGGSFNTVLGRSGIAFQGEYAHRTNLPLSIDDFEVIASAQQLPFSQLGAASGSGTRVAGYERHDVGQWQGSLSRSFGPHNPFFGDDWLLIGEAAATKVYGLPDQSALRFEGPGTLLPPLAIPGAPGVQTSGWADSFSWGYVLVTEITYNGVIGKTNLTPNIAFSHDVNGVTPSPLGNFIEDRTSVTYGVRSDYLNTIFGDLSYTQFHGAGDANVLRDRDFVSLTVKVAF